MQIDIMNAGWWLVGSAAAAIVMTNIVWLLKSLKPLAALAQYWPIRLAAWSLSALFYIVPPLAALRLGQLSPYWLGIGEIDWLSGLTTGGLLTGVVTALALFGWLVYRRGMRAVLTAANNGGSDEAAPSHKPGRPAIDVLRWRSLADAALVQWHLAFYRALAIGWLAGLMSAPPLWPEPIGIWAQQVSRDPFYWGCWLGLCAAGLEWGLNPFGRASLRDSDEVAGRAIRQAILACATTALFVLTRNFWLCLASQVVIEGAIAIWFPLPTREPVP